MPQLFQNLCGLILLMLHCMILRYITFWCPDIISPWRWTLLLLMSVQTPDLKNWDWCVETYQHWGIFAGRKCASKWCKGAAQTWANWGTAEGEQKEEMVLGNQTKIQSAIKEKTQDTVRMVASPARKRVYHCTISQGWRNTQTWVPSHSQ